MTVRTRFAPSPTGLLHIGGVRTALFSWAYAKKMGGEFILRIEDTDLVRSTAESKLAILDGMAWVGLQAQGEPIYQTQRFARYAEVLQSLLDSGHAYYCYSTKAELDLVREAQEAAGEKPRYDRTWRPEAGKILPAIPADATPVVRFKNPLTGEVAWDDAVKGRISIQNEELDDLVLARGDGSPTYNFCVVVDDSDMGITHVIRGDDHVNNTPRQINILAALGVKAPIYAHLPMILNADGQKMSKRRDAVSVVDFDAMGILPEAMLNYLARLGWGHGDDEIFTLDQFVEWFTLEHVSPSPSRFDLEKLRWTNAQHLKLMDNTELAKRLAGRLPTQVLEKSQAADTPDLAAVVGLVKERVQDLNALALECDYFYCPRTPETVEVEKHLSMETRERMQRFAQRLAALPAWNAVAIHELFKPFCAEEGIKMGQLGMPLRLLVCGTTQTPSVDEVLALIGQPEVLARLSHTLQLS